MTKVAVISANGRVGSLVVKELVERGYDVTGFGRKAQNTTVAQTYIQKDLFELTKADLANLRSSLMLLGLLRLRPFIYTLKSSST